MHNCMFESYIIEEWYLDKKIPISTKCLTLGDTIKHYISRLKPSNKALKLLFDYWEGKLQQDRLPDEWADIMMVASFEGKDPKNYYELQECSQYVSIWEHNMKE